jgi:hypothetical protein
LRNAAPFNRDVDSGKMPPVTAVALRCAAANH